MITAPFQPRAELDLSQSLEHVYEVYALTNDGARLALPLIDGQLTYDSGWAPHVQASLTLALIPEIDFLDPRLLVRIEIAAGYVYPDRTTDMPVLCRLVLRDRYVDRTGNTPVLRVSAASDESLVQDAGIVANESAGREHPILWDLDEALRALVPLALYTAFPMVTTLQPVSVMTQPLWWSEWWPLFAGWVDEAEAWWYHDGLDTWRLAPRPAIASKVAHNLTTGPKGNVTSSQSVLTREGDDWANEVWVLFRWKTPDGVEHTQVGHAWISTGPYRAYDTVSGQPWPRQGRKVITYERDTPASLATANATARALLARRAAGGRALSLSAVAAYWLRPGQTVTAQLPTGDQERQLVTRVSFSLGTGEMTVQTRLPTSATISTTGE